MTSMGVRAASAILFLFIATVNADDGGVTFWRNTVTLTCPYTGIWFDKDDKNISQGLTYEFEYTNAKKGQYRCEDDSDRYQFYVQGKVCENCFEMDASLLLVAITADVVMTGLVMVIIFKFTKKRSSAGPPHASKGQGPPVPSPDYAPLNPRTRSQETYSVVNRTG